MADGEDELPPDDSTPRKRGGQAGNVNRMTHGDRTGYLRNGILPPGCGNLQRSQSKLRAALELAVSEKYDGIITLDNLEVIDRVVRHDTRVRLYQRWLTKEHDSLDVDQRSKLLDKQGSAAESRGRAMLQLRLSADGDFWSKLLAGNKESV